MRRSFEERLDRCRNPLLRKLFRIIIEKRSNLCVAADFKSFEETVEFVERAGQHICMLKVHGEGAIDYDRLHQLKKKHNFLLFEDRKFLEPGSILKGIYASRYVKHVDLVTVVPVGNDTFEAIESAAIEAGLPEDEPRGCLALCELSFTQKLFDPQMSLEIAHSNNKTCIGIIAQHLQVPDGTTMIRASPGVHLDLDKDNTNQNWRHPKIVIGSGADIVIVGRGITSRPKEDFERVANIYKEEAYKAYLECIQKTD